MVLAALSRWPLVSCQRGDSGTNFHPKKTTAIGRTVAREMTCQSPDKYPTSGSKQSPTVLKIIIKFEITAKSHLLLP